MRRLRPAVIVAIFALVAVWVAPGSGTHDPGHPFAGNWTISFQSGRSGTFTFGLVGDAVGLAAMNATFTTAPCEEPSDYYTGTYVDRNQSGAIANTGTLAGCTTGDDRSIYAPYLPSSGVCCGFVTAFLDPSGETFSGSNYFDFDGDAFAFTLVDTFEGTFAGHFPGDGAGETDGGSTDGGGAETPETATVILKNNRFQPAQLTLEADDFLKICNRDAIFHRPFSLVEVHGNAFTRWVAPKKCFTRVMKNPTDKTIAVGIFEDLHASAKLIVLVEPDPDRLDGLPVPQFEGPLPTPPPENPLEVEVNLEEKQFKPPAARGRDGGFLVLCNLDPIIHKPFSISAPNAFTAKLRPRTCLRRMLHNRTQNPIRMLIFDELQAAPRLALTILPR
jgi:hypothetical protein